MPVEDPKTIDHDQHLFDLLILTRVFQMRPGWFGTCCAAGDSKTTFALQQFILAEGALFGAEGALFALRKLPLRPNACLRAFLKQVVCQKAVSLVIPTRWKTFLLAQQLALWSLTFAL